MGLTDKLNLLMKERKINKAELARESGVPYTTIDGFYKKGAENAKLSTLKKLCTYFDCSLDFLADDDIEDTTIINNNKNVQEENERKDFNSNLKMARERKGISQKEMSENIGVAKSTYSLYESGNREPNIQTIKKIADILNVSADELLGINEEYNQQLPIIPKNESLPSKKLSTPEYRIIEKYRGLDQHGQKIVDFILNEEHERSMTLIETYKNIAPIGDLDDIPDTFEEMEKKLVKESIRSDVG